MDGNQADDRKSLWFACAIVIGVAFAFQGSRGLWEPDEGTFCAVAGEMYDSGDLLIPTLHHNPYPEKPPLMYWGMVAGMKLLGRNEWGQRVFYAFCLAASAALTGLLAAGMWSRREGILAGMMFVTMAVPFIGGNIARPDAPLLLGTTLALCCFWKSLGTHHATLWKMLMCAAFGIAFLAKGPAALIFAAPLFVYLLCQGRALSYFLTPWAIVGVVLFALIGLSWYYYLIKLLPGVSTYFWDNQVSGRLVSGKYHRNPGLFKALLVYGPVLLFGPLPWALLWPGWAKRMAPGVFSGKWWLDLRHRSRALLIAAWVIIPMVIMSLASSKLPLYALPVFPAFALATARAWTLLAPEPARDSRMRIFGGCAAAVLIGIKCGMTYFPTDKDSRQFWDEMKNKIPAGSREFVAIDQDLNGLGFYSDLNVVEVTSHRELYPAFVPRTHLDIELQNIAKSKVPCVIISRDKKRTQLDAIEATLTKLGVPYQEVGLKYKRKLLICNAAAPTFREASAAKLGEQNSAIAVKP
jgi:4-amino-4-deoxy-L-arabinose transferase-like glycosyltransferase